MTEKINIFDGRGKGYKLYIEPFGELYHVDAGDVVQVSSAIGLGELVEITIKDDRVSLWIYGAGDYQENLDVEIGGVVQKR